MSAGRRFSIIALCLFSLILLFGPVIICDEGDVTRDDALLAIEQAEQDMQTMIDENFSVVYINDTLTSAKQALERADFAEILRGNATGELAEKAIEALEGMNWQGFTYAEVIIYTDEIASRKNWAYNISDLIRALELKIQDYEEQGIDISEAMVFFNKSVTEFEEERYVDAENFLSDAHSNLEAKKAEITGLAVITEAGKGFIEKYWAGLIISLAAAGITSYFAWRKIKIKRIHRKLKEMEVEKGVLADLMKKVQVDRFEKGSIPESIYYIRMKKYKERLTEIEETMPVFEAMQKESKILGKL